MQSSPQAVVCIWDLSGTVNVSVTRKESLERVANPRKGPMPSFMCRTGASNGTIVPTATGVGQENAASVHDACESRRVCGASASTSRGSRPRPFLIYCRRHRAASSAQASRAAAGAANALWLGVWGQADCQRDAAAWDGHRDRAPRRIRAGVAQRVVVVSALGRGRLFCLVFRAHFGSYLIRFHFAGATADRAAFRPAAAPLPTASSSESLGSGRREQRQLIFGEPFAAGASRSWNLNSRRARRRSLRSARIRVRIAPSGIPHGRPRQRLAGLLRKRNGDRESRGCPIAPDAPMVNTKALPVNPRPAISR